MAILPTPEASKGVFDAIRGSLKLFGETNKTDGLDEATNPMPIDEYESTMSDMEILELQKRWKKDYAIYYDPIKKSQDMAFNYWVGLHRNEDKTQVTSRGADGSVTDNLIFEAVETFLPIATRSNPEPLVSADPSDIGQQLAHDIKAALVNEADSQKLRRKLAQTVRHWVIYRIGVIHISWDAKIKNIKTDVIRPTEMVFDKDGYIDETGHFVGEFIGRKKKDTANNLVDMFPKSKEYIKGKAHGKMGTKLEYYEWEYCGTDIFYTMEEEVLGKFKNPNWNYDGKVKEKDPMTGEEVETEIQGTNHLKAPSYSYLFLSIFSVGDQPHDNTSLILQNITIQDMINRRYRQIDRNVDRMNNGMVVSGTAFTEEQASQASSALARGVAIRVPNGKVGDAVAFPAVNGLPNDVYNNLQDSRGEIRNIFGTSGSTPQSVKKEESVRGKILVGQQDSSRIGGTITEQIEQLADAIYNMWVQMMFVYYDEEHFITTAGSNGGMELITMKNDKFPLLKTLNITVKEGSLIPKDPLTQRNEAVDLWSQGAIDPLTLFKKLDYPDPAQATQQLILWQMLQKGQVPPEAYLPSFNAPQTNLGQAQGVGGPAVNAPTGQEVGQSQPEPATQEAVANESKQLLGQVRV